MTHTDVQQLKHGLYRVFWKGHEKISLAAVGSSSNGDRWIAPANWTKPPDDCRRTWQRVLKVELIEEVKHETHADSDDKSCTKCKNKFGINWCWVCTDKKFFEKIT